MDSTETQQSGRRKGGSKDFNVRLPRPGADSLSNNAVPARGIRDLPNSSGFDQAASGLNLVNEQFVL
jgi:hypothetical protein